MKTIKVDAEKCLLDRLHALFFEDVHQRCLFIRLSGIEALYDGWDNDIIKAAKDIILDGNIEIYFCNDTDVFIINRTMSYKRLEQFTTHLDQKLAPASVRELAQLFEIGADMGKIRKICAVKIEKLSSEKVNNKTPFPEITNEKGIDFDSLSDNSLALTLASRRRNRKNIEILVVEDDPFSQKLIHNVLSKQHSLTITGDGSGALLNYIKIAPDLLFLDIGLPDIDGHVVLQKIFSVDPDAFVVMFSGKGDRENVLRAIERGAKGFVGKPFTKEKLFQYIEKSPFVLDKCRERPIWNA